MLNILKRFFVTIIFFLFSSLLFSFELCDFRLPPDSSRVWVYWFIMDGNMSKEGITADLESMCEQGIGGVILMEVNRYIPRGKVNFMSDDWQKLFAHAVHETERLGLQLTLNSGPGWTGSGGPWIKPEQSMLLLVASEKNVKGPAKFNEKLPAPKPRKPFFGENVLPPDQEKLRKEFFKDVCVLAFPTPQGNSRISAIDEKALYVRAPYSSAPNVKPRIDSFADYAKVPQNETVTPSELLDITTKLDSDGVLNWDVPQGDWTILRFAATSNGANTRPAPYAGLGLESSKMDRDYFDIHYKNFIEKLFNAVGQRRTDGKAGWNYLHIDSWEMGSQNFSKNFIAEFHRRRKYDPSPFLPAYSGYIVDNVEKTERFLWDVRQCAQELVIENHGQYLRELAHKNNMKLSIEPYDMTPCCDMSLGAVADVPMCEFWSAGYGFNTVFSCLEATSIAHTHGKTVVGAEAFTSNNDAWRQNPKSMKSQGDWAFCIGINRITFHRFQHQPFLDRFPGFSMGNNGVHWERTQTWWNLIGDYHRYLARCQFLLQKGKAVADILYLLPEGTPQVFTPPNSAMTGKGVIKDQRGYRFDACDPITLIELATVKNGKITFNTNNPNATEYRALVLPNVETATPELLKKIEALAGNGATIIGTPPKKSPSLQNYPQADVEVQTLANQIWQTNQTDQISQTRRYREGRIILPPQTKTPIRNDAEYSEKTTRQLYPEYEFLAKIFLADGVVEDVVSENETLRFFHRVDGDVDIYFLANKNEQPFEGNISFRVFGKKVSILDPLTGKQFCVPSVVENTQTGQTTIPLYFDGFGSMFVIFDKRGAADGVPVWRDNFSQSTTVIDLSNNWTVSFESLRGAPSKVVFDKLIDWSKSEDDGIRHFSGIAVYERAFELEQKESGKRFILDLGEVEVIARVKLNGKVAGTCWAAPYRLDITDYVKNGKNILQVETANLWVNRLIGDSKLPTEKRITWTTWKNVYNPKSKLLPSGLIGPVKIKKY
ncbi:MAG: hypothetical protein LBP59_09850 [Planctomycetaceae bacterium]|jgi:hypothetical protein|nr:hypothetical protein [Planctomycetaceae bacterium]